VATWIQRTPGGHGLKVAVKDLLDVAGLPTTAGSRVVADSAVPRPTDAWCLQGVRAAEERKEAAIVGKTNLHELALGVTGINPWFGTPVNPLDPRRVPGGSSSGSAVAVATGEADVGIGTDTGGSVRIPAACCGVTGLKTTWGRISNQGVWPLAPSLDTVGPLARDVAGVAAGMALLEPGFDVAGVSCPDAVGRLRLPAAGEVDAAVDAALDAAGFTVEEIELPGWAPAGKAALLRLAGEAWECDHRWWATGRLGPDVAQRLREGSERSAGQQDMIAAVAAAWDGELARTWKRVEVVALPTLLALPPLLEDAEAMMSIRATVPVNLAGLPALALPVPCRPLPASLQLVGPAGSEERLLALGARIEAAVA
jgi:amidase